MPRTSRALLALAYCLFLLSCATPSQPKSDRDSGVSPSYSPRGPIAPQRRQIDLKELQTVLNMDRSITGLGFEEKRFNTCDVGAGYAKNANCRNQYFTVLHFQLLCRDSEGTVEMVTNFELRPVTSSRVKWKLGSIRGWTKTDNKGYGQVRAVSSSTLFGQNLMLQNGENALSLSSKNIKRIVVPRDWCD